MSNEQQHALARRNTLCDLMNKNAEKLKAAVPRGVNADRLLKAALLCIDRTPGLWNCTGNSLVRCMIDAGTLGLDVGGITGEAYMVPYGNNAQLIIGYKGYIKLARENADVATFDSWLVFRGDKFHVSLGDNPRVEHIPDLHADRTVDTLEFAYAIVRFKDGGFFQFEPMTRKELDAIRARSKAKSGPWQTDPLEMYRKAPIRRLAKRIPLGERFSLAQEIDSDSESLTLDLSDMTPDGEPTRSASDNLADEVAPSKAKNQRKRVENTAKPIEDETEPVNEPEEAPETGEDTNNELADGPNWYRDAIKEWDVQRGTGIEAATRGFNKYLSETGIANPAGLNPKMGANIAAMVRDGKLDLKKYEADEE